MEQHEYTGKKVIYWPIKWDDFKVKYNIQIDKYDPSLIKTTEEKEVELREYYNKHCKHLSTSDLCKLTEEDLLYHKQCEQYYIDEVITNYYPGKLCGSSFFPYINFCHIKEAFEYLESDFGNNMEETIRINTEKEEKEFNEAVKQHKTYKFLYYFGLIAWMTSCFWGPFVLGFFNNIITCHNIYGDDLISASIVMGFAWVCAWSFTMPVTLPLSFLIGALLHPKVLKAIIFSDDKPYCEDLMKELNHSTKQENLNTVSIAAGTLLEKYFK